MQGLLVTCALATAAARADEAAVVPGAQPAVPGYQPAVPGYQPAVAGYAPYGAPAGGVSIDAPYYPANPYNATLWNPAAYGYWPAQYGYGTRSLYYQPYIYHGTNYGSYYRPSSCHTFAHYYPTQAPGSYNAGLNAPWPGGRFLGDGDWGTGTFNTGDLPSWRY